MADLPNRFLTLGIVSDIHYAGKTERGQGNDYEYRHLANPLLRNFVRLYRRYIWMSHPLGYNHLLDRFLALSGRMDYLVANGDFSCNCQFLGVSEDGACESARECLGKLRQRFGAKLLATYGDHELGKLSFLGSRGGLRLASWHRAHQDLGLEPFWQVDLGKYELIGVASSVIALPIFNPDMLPDERSDWERVRALHLADIRSSFASLQPNQRVLLFCHDPSALSFLWQEEVIRPKLGQVEATIIGHLHSMVVWRLGRLLAGMPVIRFLGHSIERFTRALNQARLWVPFKVRLCPALAGIELVKGGGYYTVRLDTEAQEPARFEFHRMPR